MSLGLSSAALAWQARPSRARGPWLALSGCARADAPCPPWPRPPDGRLRRPLRGKWQDRCLSGKLLDEERIQHRRIGQVARLDPVPITPKSVIQGIVEAVQPARRTDAPGLVVLLQLEHDPAAVVRPSLRSEHT